MQHSCKSNLGRMRRKLYKIHPVAPKIQKDNVEYEELPNFFPEFDMNSIFQNVDAFIKTEPIKSKIFQNVVISPEALKQKLPSYSKKDKINLKINQAIKTTSAKEAHFSKRRKIPFHEVVSSAKEFLNEREKNKVKNTSLTNFSALAEALPTLDQLMEKQTEKNAKPRVSKCFSKQGAEMMEDIQTYQQVLNDAQYATDPIGTITAQLKQRKESGCL